MKDDHLLNRRDLMTMTAATGVALAASSGSAALAGEEWPVAPATKFLFEIDAQVSKPIEGGTGPDGITKRMIPIIGGTVRGPVLNGKVLPGGADWQTIRPDGVTTIYARYLLETDDGAIIEVENPGIRRAPSEVMARLVAGEDVDPSLYYFRTTPRFTTTSEKYAFLMDSMNVCTAIRKPAAAILQMFAVL